VAYPCVFCKGGAAFRWPLSDSFLFAYDGDVPGTSNYDRYGNRWDQTGSVGVHVTFTGNANKIDGYTYDAAGNMTYPSTAPFHTYYYDAENRIVQIDGNPGYCATQASGGTPTGAVPTTCNLYDALGRRVEHIDNTTATDCAHVSGTIWYDYDLQDRQIFYTNNGVDQCREEFYAAGRHLVSWANSTANFSHSDWLGTERVRASSATSTETCTSLRTFRYAVRIITRIAPQRKRVLDILRRHAYTAFLAEPERWRQQNQSWQRNSNDCDK
jgi:hypothetical protein